MKNVFLVFALVAMFSLNACCQDTKEVPAAVKTAFSQKFPDASKVKWSMENKTEWEAEFKMNGKEYSANYDVNGTWMETEYAISQNEVPANIKATLGAEFIGYVINESEISETALGKVFEFELKKGNEKKEVTVSLDGTVIKKEQAEEEGVDEDGE